MAWRDLDKDIFGNILPGEPLDTLEVLSMNDQIYYNKKPIVSRLIWKHDTAPPLREVIMMLFLIHDQYPVYQVFSKNCYFFAAVAMKAIEEHYSANLLPPIKCWTHWSCLLSVEILRKEIIIAESKAIANYFCDSHGMQHNVTWEEVKDSS